MFLKKLAININIIKIMGLLALLISLAAPTAASGGASAIAPATVGAALSPGIDPNNPITMSLHPRQTVLREGHLAAEEELWFKIGISEIGGAPRQPLNLTFFATPGDGNMVHKLHLDIFTGNYARYWSIGHPEAINNFGAGRIVERDKDPLTAELIWNGDLNNNEECLLRLRNDNPFDIDYWLFTGDIINTELGEPTKHPVVADNTPPGGNPAHALVLENGLNGGELMPGQDLWFVMNVSDLDGEMFEPKKLSLYFTPNDGNNLHQIHMDIFEAAQMSQFGAGGIVVRDNNPETGELYWGGWLIDGDDYYIRLRNGSAGVINYWLFPEEVFNPSLGELAVQ